MTIAIIGIDCAVDPAKVGLALGFYSRGQTTIQDVQLGSPTARPEDTIAQWLEVRIGPALLALDAPLGWPIRMGECLARHAAGERLGCEAHDLFRRTTDVFVKQRIGKQSLDVGADRIARTAWAALQLLQALRMRLSQEIPLAWHPDIDRVSAIEVYPAATLAAIGIVAKGYKEKSQHGAAARKRVVAAVTEQIELATAVPKMDVSSDGVDAIICALAGHHFLTNQAMPPPDDASVRREGWIWVRSREATVS